MSSVVAARRPAVPDVQAEQSFRADIQALRAIAVLAVVVNHLWPERVTGGYVGVDVFFVISGFLITTRLDREIIGTGRVRLGRFYARRIRRLLPAAGVVLVFSLVLAYLLLPYPRWAATAQHAVASVLYVENWLLAAESVNYSAADAAPSLEQHYWSLSVEEQFYLCWPLLLLLLFKLRGRWVRFAGIAVLSALSLAYGCYLTQHAPSEAYFATPVRVWEFGIGALVALAGTRLVLPARVVGLASFAGFAMIIGSALGYDPSTAFPGYLALIPTVGTALVVVAGNRAGPQWHTVITSTRPVQWVGDISYSLYLWHWPVLLLAPFALREVLDQGELATPHLLGVLAASLVLAAGSRVLVEKWGMSWRGTTLSFAVMVAGAIAVCLVAAGLHWTYGRHVAQAERDMATPLAGPCHGAAAMVSANGCAAPFGPAPVVAMGPANDYQMPAGCVPALAEPLKNITAVCDYSRGAPAPEVAWLVGDSHAAQWLAPLADLARERGWVLKFEAVGACPFANVSFTGYRGRATEQGIRNCTTWSANLTDTIAAAKPAMVFVSFFARMEFVDDGSGRSQTEQYRAGLEEYWRTWTRAGARVVVLADPPLNGDVRPEACVTLNPDNPVACAQDRVIAQPPDPLTEVARSSHNPGVSLVDLTDSFCDAHQCYSVVGNVVVYYDANHLNTEFSRSLTPMLASALDQV